MKRASKATFILILLVGTLLFQTSPHVKGEPNERFTITMSVTYSNNGPNVWNLTGEDYAISLFMNNSWQSVSLVEYSLPLISVRNDSDGNHLGYLNLTQLKPGHSVSYTVKYDVISKPRLLPNITEKQSQNLSDIHPDLKNDYCKGEGPWLIDNPNLQELATSRKGSETRVLSIVKNLVIWIRDHIQYNSAEGPRYPNETYTERKGDCDDQAILLITLCRILGIPAYLQVGCIYDFLSYSNETYWQGHVTSVLKKIGWHGWAIVYIPPWGWLPVDLTYVSVDPNLKNPLNAIKGGAVTGQDTIQYMNFTHTDYVAASRHLKEFIQSNGFYVYTIDEMNIDFGSLLGFIKLVLTEALIVMAVIAVSSAAIFAYIWKRMKKP